MEAKELRLENYLFFPFINSNVKLCGLPLNQNNSLYIQAQPIDGTVIFIEKIEAFQPITPTEEILLKCGFKKRNLLFINDIIPFVKILKCRDCFDVIIGNVFYVKLYSLHQLQNLYFALTGQELEINL